MSFLRSDAAPLYRYQGVSLLAPLFSLPESLLFFMRTQELSSLLIMLSRRLLDGSACATQVRCFRRWQMRKMHVSHTSSD
jgi:hypothetical protein